MSESPNTVYLISGATRGIGFGLVTSLVARENVIVFAGARDPSGVTSTALQALVKEHPGKLHFVQLASASEEDAGAAAARVREVAGHVDVVIANAGIAETFAPAHEVPIDAVEHHFKVNAIGPLVLFQAFYVLLRAAPRGVPKFVVISSFVGSIEAGAALPLGLSAYGTSKAAINYLTRKIHFENERLVAFAVHPGTVATDAARLAGALDAVPHISVAESVRTVLARVDEATREKNGGMFVTNEGERVPW
ncbi:hypothetical protein PLICRDRAFT_45941 [Plicaturopsis crispa FD-325 SS-3]|uniref:NAD(P)-binding protein n=1 Tax=Plicaturopsis crispa FD-325 SS-3 TaxID=944288 RepID=A0A0C9SXS0_PLICR|nr:hypothetical protein PLICRDRAFT_45941 [Plicaturopsis crispa FD-325 SS-3]